MSLRGRLSMAACMLLLGCGGEDAGTLPLSPLTLPQASWVHEAAFRTDPLLAARARHTAVLELEPASYLGEWQENTVRYALEAGNYRFCLDDDPLITEFRLEDAANNTVLTLARHSGCRLIELPAGVYTKRIMHEGGELLEHARTAGTQPRSRAAFVNATNIPRLTDAQGRPRGGWWALQPAGSAQQQALRFSLRGARRVPLQHVGPDALFRFAGSDFDRHPPFYPGSLSTPFLSTTGAGDEHGRLSLIPDDKGRYLLASSGGEQLYACRQSRVHLSTLEKSATADSGDFPICLSALLTLTDLGAYNVQFHAEIADFPRAFFSMVDDRLPGFDGVQVNLIQQDSEFEQHNRPASFRILFRFFRPVKDGDDPSIIELQTGEIALFEQCNYGGKAWVFAVDAPDFGKLSPDPDATAYYNHWSGNFLDDAISAVKVGPGTAVELFAEADYRGPSMLIAADTPCLRDTVVGENRASGLKIIQAVKEFVITSRGCVGCKLQGLDLRGRELDDMDFSKADLSFARLNENHLRNTRFIDATLERTNFNFARLDGAVFTGANLSGATLVGASLPGARLDQTTLIGTNFTQAHLYGNIEFTGATMTRAVFNETVLFRARLAGDLRGALFNRAVLVDALFDAAVLDEAVFNGAWLQGASFRGVHSARDANWTNACMSADSGSWHFLRPDGVSEPVSYGVTELGALGSEASLICPSGDSGPCCPTGDLGACVGSGKLKPHGNPQPPDCLPDPDSWDGCRTPDPDEHYSLPTCTN